MKVDLVVLGGGSGGLAAAKRAAELGAKVVLCEPDALGGTCVNRGCVPKKLLWQVARHWTERAGLSHAARASKGELSYAQLSQTIGAHISSLNESFADDLKTRGITLLRERGYIQSPGRVKVGAEIVTADRILIATGARPNIPDMPGAELCDTSDDVFGWTEVPKRLIIMGGGYIGAEFASIFNALGAQVTLLQSGERLLPKFHAQAVGLVTETMAQRGIDVMCNTKPEAVRSTNQGLEVTCPGGETLQAERVICAIGRTPNIDDIGLADGDLRRASSGALSVSSEFETSQPGIFAIGDAADRLPLTPVATRDGTTFAEQAFGAGGAPIDLAHVATAAFTLPSVAQVGDTDDETYTESDVGALRNPVLAPEISPKDFFRVTQKHGNLSGAVLVSLEAAEMIAPLASLISCGAPADSLASATAIHPSFAEEFVGG